MKEKSNTNQLPKDWERKKFADIIEFLTDFQANGSFTGLKQNVQYYSRESFSVLVRLKDLRNVMKDKNSFVYTDEKGYNYLKKSRVVEGDILVANVGAGVGTTLKMPRFEGRATLGPNMFRVDLNGSISKQYFLEFSKSIDYWNQLKLISAGSGQPKINKSQYRSIQIPLPPVSTQQAIVSKIEELFSELDKGIEQLKLVQQQLKTYRQAVLKWAYEGKLTNKSVKDGELPKGWKWVKSGSLFDFVTSGSRGWAKYYSESGAIFIRITNLDFNSLDLDLEESKIQYVNPPTNSEGIRTKVQEGDFLFSITGYLGMFAIAPKLDNAFVNQHISLCRPKTGFNKQFIGYWIISKSGGHHYLNKMTKGATKAGLGLDDIKNFPVPIAPLEEQNRIVQEIESRLSIADKMEETISQSLQQAEALRQSILKKAFEGKLVATDTIETIKQTAKVIPLERKVLAGKIIHLLHDDKYFGLTKFQKILYLVENFAEVPFETNFIQERAGPYDKEFTIAFRKEMQEKDWLQEEQKGNITKFIPGDSIGSLIKNYAVYFREKGKQIVFVIQQLKDKSTHDAELIATLYAVWNNRLIRKKSVKIELLVEDFFNWSAKKKEEFQPEEVVSTYKWMKKIKFIPSGFGKAIGTN